MGLHLFKRNRIPTCVGGPFSENDCFSKSWIQYLLAQRHIKESDKLVKIPTCVGNRPFAYTVWIYMIYNTYLRRPESKQLSIYSLNDMKMPTCVGKQDTVPSVTFIKKYPNT